MPEQQRRALLLREWQGLSYKEIADELDLSQAAVETLLFRARRSLATRARREPKPKRPSAKRVSRRRRRLVLALLKSCSSRAARRSQRRSPRSRRRRSSPPVERQSVLHSSRTSGAPSRPKAHEVAAAAHRPSPSLGRRAPRTRSSSLRAVERQAGRGCLRSRRPGGAPHGIRGGKAPGCPGGDRAHAAARRGGRSRAARPSPPVPVEQPAPTVADPPAPAASDPAPVAAPSVPGSGRSRIAAGRLRCRLPVARRATSLQRFRRP